MNEQAIAHMIPHFEPEMDVYDKRRLWTNMVISEWDCTNPLAFIYEIVLKLNSHSENPASRVQVLGEMFFVRDKIVNQRNTFLVRKHLPGSCIDEVYIKFCNTGTVVCS